MKMWKESGTYLNMMKCFRMYEKRSKCFFMHDEVGTHIWVINSDVVSHMWLCIRSISKFFIEQKNASRPPWGGVSRTWPPCSPSSFCSGWRWPPSPPPSTSSPSRRRRCLRSENKYLFSYSTLLILLYKLGFLPQSRQSARLFIQLSELGPSHPLPHRRVCPSPIRSGVGGGGRILACGGGGGGSKFGRGDGVETSVICTLWVLT